MSLKGRKVKTLRLHQPGQAKNYGAVNSPLVASKGEPGLKQLEITVVNDAGAVLCSGNGPEGKFEFYIPNTNIVCGDLLPEKEDKK